MNYDQAKLFENSDYFPSINVCVSISDVLCFINVRVETQFCSVREITCNIMGGSISTNFGIGTYDQAMHNHKET